MLIKNKYSISKRIISIVLCLIITSFIVLNPYTAPKARAEAITISTIMTTISIFCLVAAGISIITNDDIQAGVSQIMNKFRSDMRHAYYYYFGDDGVLKNRATGEDAVSVALGEEGWYRVEVDPLTVKDLIEQVHEIFDPTATQVSVEGVWYNEVTGSFDYSTLIQSGTLKPAYTQTQTKPNYVIANYNDRVDLIINYNASTGDLQAGTRENSDITFAIEGRGDICFDLKPKYYMFGRIVHFYPIVSVNPDTGAKSLYYCANYRIGGYDNTMIMDAVYYKGQRVTYSDGVVYAGGDHYPGLASINEWLYRMIIGDATKAEVIDYTYNPLKDLVNVLPLNADGTLSVDIPQELVDSLVSGQVATKDLADLLTQIKVNTDAIVDTANPAWEWPTGDIDADSNRMRLPQIIINKFPFCIPFDLYKLMAVFVASPKIPKIDKVIKFGDFAEYKLNIDLSNYVSLAKLVRAFFVLIFVAALAWATKKILF